ncbi:MAG: nitrilase family protein [Cytophagaceae bacterium]|nr:nitrilase family protein [Cytophagaceae bacterium]|tara:strand:+ start:15376 stop:16149 length:774 start_codon:yes stop_codon:yes gene_type:complete
MDNTLTVAAIQGALAWEDPAANREYLDARIDAISRADLVVLPEMFSTGFSMRPQGLAEDKNGATLQWMLSKAAQKSMAIAGSLMVQDGTDYYNRFYFVEPGGEVTTYDKYHLFTLGGEHEPYTKGKGPVTVNYRGFKFFLQICYDLRFPVFSRNTMRYDAVLYVANWPKTRILAWDTLLRARAIENMAYCIGVNRLGIDGDGYEYTGHSGIYDALGQTLAFANENEAIITATISKSHINETRRKLNFLEDQDLFVLQ